MGGTILKLYNTKFWGGNGSIKVFDLDAPQISEEPLFLKTSASAILG
jgi:hypothetical protein